MHKKLQSHYVAKQFRDGAVLIGPRQVEEVTLASGHQIVPGLGLDAYASSLAARAIRLEDGVLKLAVVGAVSSGKSTLINALLGGEVLPVSVGATTGMITQISFGEKGPVTLIEKSGKKKNISREVFIKEGVLDEKTGKLPNPFAGIDSAVLESDAFLCQKGLCLVDTPGFNSGPKMEAVIRNYLKQVDAVLLVINGIAPFDDKELAFIKSLKRGGDPKLNHVFFVINAWDLDDKRKAAYLNVAHTCLSDEFNAGQLEHHVCMVDAHTGLEAKCDEGKIDVLKATGLPALEQRLTQCLEEDRRVDVIVDAAVCDVLIPALIDIKGCMETQHELLTQSDGISEIDRHTAEAQLTSLKQTASTLQDIFNNYAKEIGDTVSNSAIAYLIELVNPSNPKWRDLTIELGILELTSIYLSTEKRNEFVQKITEQLTAYFQRNMSGLQNAIFKDIEEKMEVISKTLDEKTAALFQETPEHIHQIGMDRLLDSFLQAIPDVIVEFIKREVLLTRLVLTLGTVLIGISFPLVNLPIRVPFILMMFLGIVIYLYIRVSKKPVKIRASEELKRKLEERAGELKHAILQSIDREFEKVLETHTSNINRENLGVATAEKNRLKTLNTLFTAEFEEICQMAYGRQLTREEIQRFSESRG